MSAFDRDQRGIEHVRDELLHGLGWLGHAQLRSQLILRHTMVFAYSGDSKAEFLDELLMKGVHGGDR